MILLTTTKCVIWRVRRIISYGQVWLRHRLIIDRFVSGQNETTFRFTTIFWLSLLYPSKVNKGVVLFLKDDVLQVNQMWPKQCRSSVRPQEEQKLLLVAFGILDFSVDDPSGDKRPTHLTTSADRLASFLFLRVDRPRNPEVATLYSCLGIFLVTVFWFSAIQTLSTSKV